MDVNMQVFFLSLNYLTFDLICSLSPTHTKVMHIICHLSHISSYPYIYQPTTAARTATSQDPTIIGLELALVSSMVGALPSEGTNFMA